MWTEVWEFIKFLTPIVGAIAQFLAFAFLFWLKREFVLRVTYETAIANIMARQAKADTALAALAARVEQLPGKDDLTDIRLHLRGITGAQEVQGVQLTAVNRDVQRVEGQINMLNQRLMDRKDGGR